MSSSAHSGQTRPRLANGFISVAIFFLLISVPHTLCTSEADLDNALDDILSDDGPGLDVNNIVDQLTSFTQNGGGGGIVGSALQAAMKMLGNMSPDQIKSQLSMVEGLLKNKGDNGAGNAIRDALTATVGGVTSSLRKAGVTDLPDSPESMLEGIQSLLKDPNVGNIVSDALKDGSTLDEVKKMLPSVLGSLGQGDLGNLVGKVAGSLGAGSRAKAPSKSGKDRGETKNLPPPEPSTSGDKDKDVQPKRGAASQNVPSTQRRTTADGGADSLLLNLGLEFLQSGGLGNAGAIAQKTLNFLTNSADKGGPDLSFILTMANQIFNSGGPDNNFFQEMLNMAEFFVGGVEPFASILREVKNFVASGGKGGLKFLENIWKSQMANQVTQFVHGTSSKMMDEAELMLEDRNLRTSRVKTVTRYAVPVIRFLGDDDMVGVIKGKSVSAANNALAMIGEEEIDDTDPLISGLKRVLSILNHKLSVKLPYLSDEKVILAGAKQARETFWSLIKEMKGKTDEEIKELFMQYADPELVKPLLRVAVVYKKATEDTAGITHPSKLRTCLRQALCKAATGAFGTEKPSKLQDISARAGSLIVSLKLSGMDLDNARKLFNAIYLGMTHQDCFQNYPGNCDDGKLEVKENLQPPPVSTSTASSSTASQSEKKGHEEL